MGRVGRITDFGTFIEVMPGVDGLLHVSEMANYRVANVRDELKEGENIEVKVINIDPSGKVRLSRKVLLAEGEGTSPCQPGHAPNRQVELKLSLRSDQRRVAKLLLGVRDEQTALDHELRASAQRGFVVLAARWRVASSTG